MSDNLPEPAGTAPSPLEKETTSSPAPRQNRRKLPLKRLFVITDFTRSGSRALIDHLDEQLDQNASSWRLSVRHQQDYCPEAIARLPADALVVDNGSGAQISAAHQTGIRLLVLKGVFAPDLHSAGIPQCVTDPLLAGELIADTLLRRGYHKTQLLAGSGTDYNDFRSGLLAEFDRIGIGSPEEVLSDFDSGRAGAAVALTFPTITPPDSAPEGVSSSFCRLSLERNDANAQTPDREASSPLVVGPSPHWQALSVLRWLIDTDRPTPSRVPPAALTEAAVNGLPQAFSDALIANVSAFIDQQLANGGRCDIGDISAGFSVPRRTLERRFRDCIGTSIHREITRRQVSRATRLLLVAGKSPADAALAVGYPDTRMLSINFRKLLGISPRAFQREISDRFV